MYFLTLQPNRSLIFLTIHIDHVLVRLSDVMLPSQRHTYENGYDGRDMSIRHLVVFGE